MSLSFKLGIVGGGSLGKSLLTHFWKKYHPQTIISTQSAHSKQELQTWLQRNQYCADVTINNAEVAQMSQVLLCVKPTQAKEACKSMRTHLSPNTVIISAMAAVPLTHMQEWLNHENVVRIMPTVLYDSPICVYNPHDCKIILPHDNRIEFDDEIGLEGTVGVSGCMPGLMSYVLQQWIEAVINMGYNQRIAEKLVLENMQALAKNSFQVDDLENIRKAVTSPGGATAKGVETLKQYHLDHILNAMLQQIEERLEEIVPEK